MVFDQCASTAGVLAEVLIAGLGERGKVRRDHVHELWSGQATRGCSLAGLLLPERQNLIAVLNGDPRYAQHGLLLWSGHTSGPRQAFEIVSTSATTTGAYTGLIPLRCTVSAERAKT